PPSSTPSPYTTLFRSEERPVPVDLGVPAALPEPHRLRQLYPGDQADRVEAASLGHLLGASDHGRRHAVALQVRDDADPPQSQDRSEEHTSELQSRENL